MTTAEEILLQIMRERRSVREFRPEPVSEEALEKLLEAARWAPSAGNRQAYRFYVVRSRKIITAMAAAVQESLATVRTELRDEARENAEAYLSNFVHFASAPVVIVPIHRGGIDLIAVSRQGTQSANATSCQAEENALSSVAAAIMNLLLCAQALGLGACWMTGPLLAAEALQSLLKIPQGWTISALIPVGRPAQIPPAPTRRPLRQLVRYVDDPEPHR